MVRKIDTWSVLKVSALFSLSLVLVLLIAGVILWALGSAFGAIGGAEKFMRAIGFEDFRFVGSQLLKGFTAAGLVLVILGTGLAVLIAVVYNLISDVVGGIEVTVLEEDTRAVPPPAVPATRAAAPSPDRRPARSRPVEEPVEAPVEVPVRGEDQPVAPGYPA